MCVEEQFVDRYPDGVEEMHRETVTCARRRSGRSCNEVKIIKHRTRNIQHGETTTRVLRQTKIVQSSPPGISQHASPPSFVQIIDDGSTTSSKSSHRSSRSSSSRRSSHMGDFILDAFWGERPRARRRSSSKSKTRVRFEVDTPPSTPPSAVLLPAAPFPPLPHHGSGPQGPRGPSSPLGPRHPPPPPPPPHHPGPSGHVGHVYGPRLTTLVPRPEYSRPIIVDARHPAGSSTYIPTLTQNAPATPPSSPRPSTADLERDAAELERRRRTVRDERAARLSAELLEREQRRESERRIARLNAEIAARPAVPLTAERIPSSPLPLRPSTPPVTPYNRHRPVASPIIDQAPILDAALRDLQAIRGERLLLQAQTERRQAEVAARATAILDERRRVRNAEAARSYREDAAADLRWRVAAARDAHYEQVPRADRLRRRTGGGLGDYPGNLTGYY